MERRKGPRIRGAIRTSRDWACLTSGLFVKLPLTSINQTPKERFQRVRLNEAVRTQSGSSILQQWLRRNVPSSRSSPVLPFRNSDYNSLSSDYYNLSFETAARLVQILSWRALLVRAVVPPWWLDCHSDKRERGLFGFVDASCFGPSKYFYYSSKCTQIRVKRSFPGASPARSLVILTPPQRPRILTSLLHFLLHHDEMAYKDKPQHKALDFRKPLPAMINT